MRQFDNSTLKSDISGSLKICNRCNPQESPGLSVSALKLPIWGYPGLPTLRQTIHLVIFCSYDQLCSLWPSLVSPKTIIIQVATDWRFVNYDATDFSWGPGQAGPAAGKGLSVSMLTAVSRSDFWEALSDSRWKVVILKTFTGSIKCIKIL